jgi:dihydrofolate synthase / folylpolyglutamate synthase
MNFFDQAFQKLADLTNYERKKPDAPYRFDLAGMEQLLLRLGSPEKMLGKVVQVGGSKGKGTVSSLLAGLYHRTGATSGVYASPHVRDLTERIQYCGKPVSRDELVAHVERVGEVLIEGQTWFEAWTAVAVLLFAERQPDVCIFEVGLGGRLDSTTALPRQACCLTRVELEHTQVLGETIAEIAAEKAAILRPGMTCVTGFSGVALDLLVERAETLQVPLRVLGRDFVFELQERTSQGFRVRFEVAGREGVVREVPLYAEVQVESLTLACALLRELDMHRFDEIFALGFDPWVREALPPARFQVLRQDPPVVVDGAHTDESLGLLARDLEAAFPGRRFRMVLGMAAGKQYRCGLGRLAPLVDRAWVAPILGKPSQSPTELMTFLREKGVACELCGGIGEAVESAWREREEVDRTSEVLAAASSGRSGLLVTGSLYAAGEALAILEGK